MSKGAQYLLYQAQVYSTLQEALQDIQYTVAFTRWVEGSPHHLPDLGSLLQQPEVQLVLQQGVRATQAVAGTTSAPWLAPAGPTAAAAAARATFSPASAEAPPAETGAAIAAGAAAVGRGRGGAVSPAAAGAEAVEASAWAVDAAVLDRAVDARAVVAVDRCDEREGASSSRCGGGSSDSSDCEVSCGENYCSSDSSMEGSTSSDESGDELPCTTANGRLRGLEVDNRGDDALVISSYHRDGVEESSGVMQGTISIGTHSIEERAGAEDRTQKFTNQGQAPGSGGVVMVMHETRGVGRIEASNAPLPKIALIFGREEFGLSDEEVACCDVACSIPIGRLQESLSVGHAVSIVLSQFFQLKQGLSASNVASPSCM